MEPSLEIRFNNRKKSVSKESDFCRAYELETEKDYTAIDAVAGTKTQKGSSPIAQLPKTSDFAQPRVRSPPGLPSTHVRSTFKLSLSRKCKGLGLKLGLNSRNFHFLKEKVLEHG
jgi:hypothetical protein